jgi:hypothetical protein
MMGYERTNNPTPSAAALLGKARVKRAKAKLKRKGIKKRHKGNPLPAVVGLLGGLAGKLGGRFRKPSEVRAAAVAEGVIQAANAGNLTAAAGLIERATKPMKMAEHAVWAAAAARLSPSIVQQVKANAKNIPAADQSDPEHFAASVLGNPVQAAATGSPAASGFGTALNILQQPGTIRALGAVARGGRQRRQRYPTYTDRYGRQRYSTKPPGGELRLPAGATPSAGTPYSFFQGAIGKGGAATTAGQLAVAGAAGVGAYLVTRRLLQYVGGKAQRAEEAGVNAARALHDALEDYRANTGKYPPPAERARMKEAYRAKLVELGYNPDTFTRTRSGFESFVEDYNPLGG